MFYTSEESVSTVSGRTEEEGSFLYCLFLSLLNQFLLLRNIFSFSTSAFSLVNLVIVANSPLDVSFSEVKSSLVVRSSPWSLSFSSFNDFTLDSKPFLVSFNSLTFCSNWTLSSDSSFSLASFSSIWLSSKSISIFLSSFTSISPIGLGSLNLESFLIFIWNEVLSIPVFFFVYVYFLTSASS